MKVSYLKQSGLTKLGLITSSILVAFQILNWPILKLWNIYGGGNFIDLHLVLEFSKCFKESDIDIYSPASPCPGYIYGKPLLYIFSLFGDSYSVTKLIGFIFLFIISFTLAGIFNTDSWRKQLLSISVMLSPPMLLLIERGNIDSLIFLSVFCSAIFWSRNFHLFSLITIALATLFKFYTFPIFFILIILEKSTKTRLKIVAISLPVFIYSIWNLSEIKSAHPGGFSWKFGMAIWLDYFELASGANFHQVVNQIIGLSFLVLCIYLVSKIIKLNNINFQNSLKDKKSYDLVYLFLLTSHVACFAAGQNFDYRLIFLIGTSAAYFNIERDKQGFIFVAVLLLISTWLTYPIQVFQPIGDLATELLTSYFIVYAYRRFSNQFKMKFIV